MRALRGSGAALADDYRAGRIELGADLFTAFRACFSARPVTVARGAASEHRKREARERFGDEPELISPCIASDDLYACWLDTDLSYTCACDPLSAPSLSLAQVKRFDRVARTLELSSGQRVLEIDAGFGCVALHLARHHGVFVRCFVSTYPRAEWVRRRAKLEGLSGRVDVLFGDGCGVVPEYDACIALGKPDHRRLGDHERFALALQRGLKPDGRALIHGITRMRPRAAETWTERAIFPGEPVPALSEVLHALDHPELELRSVTNLAHDHAKTLGVWLDRLDKNADVIGHRFGLDLLRAWRLYMAGAAAALATGTCALSEIVLQRLPRSTQICVD